MENAYAKQLKEYAAAEVEKLITTAKHARDAYQLPKSDSEVIEAVKNGVASDFARVRYFLNGAPQTDSGLSDTHKAELVLFYMNQYAKGL